MVFVWGWGGGPRRRRGYGPGSGRGGYGPPPGYGGYGRGYGRGYGGGGGGCLRDLLLLNTGCCLAESLGCGMDLLLMGPSSWRQGRGSAGGPLGGRGLAAVGGFPRGGYPPRRRRWHLSPASSAHPPG